MSISASRIIQNNLDTTHQLRSPDDEKAHLKSALHKRDVFMFKALAALQTPVTAIYGFCGLIKESDLSRLSEDQREHFEKVMNACEALDGLMTDITDLSRILSGRAAFDISPRDLSVVIRTVNENLFPQALEKGLLLQWDQSAVYNMALFDASGIQRVLHGLVDNAIRFTAPGGQVKIEVEDCDSEIHVHVRDTGIGIEAAMLEKMLAECSPEAALSEETGCGLGLALYRAIIHAHQGRLWAQSRPGCGSCFSFSLPISSPLTS
jgi:signal transduction histidine kinase